MSSSTEPSYSLLSLYSRIRVSPRATYCLQCPCNIRPNHRYVADEARNRRKEVSKKHQYTIKFDYEADEGPAHKDKRYASDKGKRSLPLLFASEEGDRLCSADDEREAN